MTILKGEEAIAEVQRRLPSETFADLTPEDRAEFTFDTTPVPVKTVTVDVPRIIVQAGMAPSRTAARRLILAGAVTIDDMKCTGTKIRILEGWNELDIRVGRQVRRVELTEDAYVG